MKEIFRIIPSFPDYSVSNVGRVKTNSRLLRYVHAKTGEEHFRKSEERFLKVHFNNLTGYKMYQLYKDKKMKNKPIHQLVADAFIPRIAGLDYINHKDGNKHNNIIENLEWCTNAYNHEHATKTGLMAKGERVGTSKLNERSIRAIQLLNLRGVRVGVLAEAFNVSHSSISLIINGKIWKHLTGTELIYIP